MNTRGVTTSAMKDVADSSHFFFGRFFDFSGTTAFFKFVKKSPRLRIAISCPSLVF
jgi:hypothetical protein